MLISAPGPRHAPLTDAARRARSLARRSTGAALVTLAGVFSAAAAQSVSVKCHADNLTVHEVPLAQAQAIVPAEHRDRVGADAEGMATVQIYTCDGIIGGQAGHYVKTMVVGKDDVPPSKGGPREMIVAEYLTDSEALAATGIAELVGPGAITYERTAADERPAVSRVVAEHGGGKAEIAYRYDLSGIGQDLGPLRSHLYAGGGKYWQDCTAIMQAPPAPTATAKFTGGFPNASLTTSMLQDPVATMNLETDCVVHKGDHPATN